MQIGHCQCVYGFQFCIAAAQDSNGILTVRNRNLKNFLGVRQPLRVRSLSAGGDHATNIFKRVQDAKKGRYLIHFEIEKIDSAQKNPRRRALKLRAIVKIDRLFDGVDNTIVKERWRIRGLNEARRVKSPIAEAAVGVGDVVEAPVLVRTKPPVGRARRIVHRSYFARTPRPRC